MPSTEKIEAGKSTPNSDILVNFSMNKIKQRLNNNRSFQYFLFKILLTENIMKLKNNKKLGKVKKL